MPAKLTHDVFVDRISSKSDQFTLADGQVYSSLDSALTFNCSRGHQPFSTKPRHILTKNSGCPVCGQSTVAALNATSIDSFVQRLADRNSKYDPIEYVSSFAAMTKPATFKCLTCDHTWTTLPKSIIAGSGCPACNAAKLSLSKQYTHSQFMMKLEQRNVDYQPVYPAADQVYSGIASKMRFECSIGHSWVARPGDILNNKSGCPHCAGTVKRSTGEAFQDLFDKWPHLQIVSRHGEQLGRRELLEVECHAGHNWDTHYERLMSGHYCPHCNGNAKYTSDAFIGKLAATTSTIVVVGSYVGSHTPIEVECRACQHRWHARPYNLLNGYGCPQCSINNKFSKKAVAWLKAIEKTDNIKLQYACQDGEFRIPGTNYRADGYCADTNTVYEFYGDYWHGNPTKFERAEFNVQANKTYGQLYEDTMVREQAIKAAGFSVISIWEDQYDKLVSDQFLHRVLDSCSFDQFILDYHDSKLLTFKSRSKTVHVINVDVPPDSDARYATQSLHDQSSFILFSDEVIAKKQLIAKKLNHYDQRGSVVPSIHARKCEIRQCSKQEKKTLLDANHVQGNDNAPYAYGAFYGGKLVAVMTFSKPRVALGQKGNKCRDGHWELSRFCTDVNYRIPGIASKLLTHFKRAHNWTEIYSYADKRWSVGNMYHQLGFDLVADNPPDYFYVIKGIRKHRWNYRKDIIKNTLVNYDPALTEYQNMENHGFWRVWDCGTLKFSITNPNPNSVYASPE